MSAPAIRTIAGTGRPRIELIKGTPEYTSVNTVTYTSSSVSEPLGSAKSITLNNTSTYPTTVTTSGSHLLNVGDYVEITGHTYLNGTWLVTGKPASNQFQVDTSVAGTSTGTAKYSPAFVSRGFTVNQRIYGNAVTTGEPTWARIMEVTSETFMYTTSWSNGTPTGTFYVGGFIVDLPMCQQISLKFTPVQNEKLLWRNRVVTEFEGYWLEATLDYSTFIVGDDLINLQDILNADSNDQLILIPHIDESKFEYNVYLSRPFTLANFGRGQGHKGMVLTFQSNELVDFIETSGYGFGYGTNYGTQL